MSKKKKLMPVKRTMNLYFKPDRTSKSATVMLYTLFVLVVLSGLGKVLVYDLWVKVVDARVAAALAQERLSTVMAELSDFNDVKKKYRLYSATDEEREQIDRMEVVRLLDQKVGSLAQVLSYTVSGMEVHVQIDQVTLAQTAEIVRRLETSPIVAYTMVNTAITKETGTAGDANAASDTTAAGDANAAGNTNAAGNKTAAGNANAAGNKTAGRDTNVAGSAGRSMELVQASIQIALQKEVSK